MQCEQGGPGGVTCCLCTLISMPIAGLMMPLVPVLQCFMLALSSLVVLLISQSDLSAAQPTPASGQPTVTVLPASANLDPSMVVFASTWQELVNAMGSRKQHVVILQHLDLTKAPKLVATSDKIQFGSDGVLSPGVDTVSIRVRVKQIYYKRYAMAKAVTHGMTDLASFPIAWPLAVLSLDPSIAMNVLKDLNL
jgi:hypothetical protein